MDILVFDKGISLGTFTVPEPLSNELITIYEAIPFDKNAPIDIMYFPDLYYGIVITDKMVDYINELEEMI